MTSEVGVLLRDLPPVHRLLHSKEAQSWLQEHSRTDVLLSLQSAVDTLRASILAGERPEVTDEATLAMARTYLHRRTGQNLRPVINATGTVLHTNLGRAPLAKQAIAALVEVAQGYSNLEYRLEEGVRGHRYEHVEALICELTGAEAALVVNNNAAAVFLVLTELAKEQKVVISRGELVEIGGSFRVSEVMRASGAELVEVGTTNKTHVRDYADALEAGAKLVLRVHTSNFRIIGFTSRPELSDLTTLAHEHGAALIEDLGSGSLIDLRERGIGDEPTVRESILAGVDVVTFSGDKLLGGAQAGIICGKAQWITRIRQNQLARAVRVDKLTLAALEATLRLYIDKGYAMAHVPVLRMLTRAPEELQEEADRVAHDLAAIVAGQAQVRVVPTMSQVGGGALPSEQLPSYAVAVSPHVCSVSALMEQLRLRERPIVARVVKEEVLLDVRTIFPEEFVMLVQGITEALAQAAQTNG
ncbi:MAG: L-seryl-tRNA(Sec) selenium transferase [Firmicutes bacterium]|nr:L-seryl-tRNA(Sec) selenium transferase [Bacillota bacterium]